MSSHRDSPDSHGPKVHVVELFGDNEQLLARNVGRYLGDGLRRGDSLLVAATTDHAAAFCRQLELEGLNAETAVAAGRLVFLNAEKTLSRCMANGQPTWERFDDTIGTVVRDIRAKNGHTGLRAYGELVGLLWKAGDAGAAVSLEQYWNRLMGHVEFSLYCAYPIDVFGNEFQVTTLDGILRTHTHLLPTRWNGDLRLAMSHAMDEILGDKADALRFLIKTNFRAAWAKMSDAEATILWLRNNLPDYSDEILALARQHCEQACLTSRAGGYKQQ